MRDGGSSRLLVMSDVPASTKRHGACLSCRSGKVKCEGGDPCPRCRVHKRECVYTDKGHDASHDRRFEALGHELHLLRQEVAAIRAHTCSLASPTQLQSPNAVSPSGSTVTSTLPTASTTGKKRKRSQLELQHQTLLDFLRSGLISETQARAYFDMFFQGCDRYVPVFDPVHDTFESIRRRSGFLFNALCTTGSSIKEEAGSRLPYQLNFELKKQLNIVVLSQDRPTLETVQALLVLACYSPERSLILSLATRTALDLGLDQAFDQLTRKLMPKTSSLTEAPNDSAEHAELMRSSRTWFGLLVLENILHVDAGKLPTFTSTGGVRRCRVLLQQPYSTALDLRLLSQVELNYIRARIHDSWKASGQQQDEDILDQVRDARIDIELWFHDWSTLISSSSLAGSEKPSLLVNLSVQRHWSDAMAVFRAVKCLGTDNIDAMGQAGRDLLDMAKASLKEHLAITIDESNMYLANLRFSMDFVWAKCAFCFLLLLKLMRLLPESEEENSRLLDSGNSLLRQLSSAGTGAGSSANRLYLQVLSISLEKYGRALGENHRQQLQSQEPATFFWESTDANKELQSFVPEQFVFEWDFPGLTLFSSPTAWQEFFDDFLLGFSGP